MSTLDVVLRLPEKYLDFKCDYFLSRTVTDEHGCLLWQGAKASVGYGHTKVDGSWVDIHIFIATCKLVTTIEEREATRGKLVCHKCNVRACINWEHLYFGDKSTNALDAVASGSLQKGETNNFARLTQQEVDEIKHLLKYTDYSQTRIALAYGVTQSNISAIKLGKSWR